MVHFNNQNLDGDSAPAHSIQAPSADNTQLAVQRSTTPLLPARGALFSNYYAWDTLNTNDRADEAAFFNAELPSQGVLQDFHGFCPNPGVGAAQFASELDNASPNELHGSQPTDFAFTNVPQYLAPQTSDRRFPTYAAPFVQQYAVHQFDFAPVSEREMPSTMSTTYQQQNNHQHTSRAPASALSTRGHAIQASAPAFTAPNMAFANIASSSRTSPAFEQLRNHIGGPHPFRQRPTIPLHDDGEGWNPFHNTFGRCATALDTRRPQTSNGFRTASRGHIQRSPTAGPSRNPHGSVSAFSSSTMELYGQGLNQTLVADNDLSSKQSFEGDFPQDLLSFGATSSPATGSSVPPSHARKRKYDAMDDRKGKVAARVGDAPATKKLARCLIDGCGKLFNRYPDLIRHQEQSNIHRGPNAPLYHCTYCWGLSSARRDNVKRHFRTCPRYTGKIRVGSRRRLVYDGQLAYLTMAEANIWKALQDIEGQDTVQDEVVGGDDGKGDGEGDGGDEDATDGEEEDGGSMLDGEDD